MIRLKTPWSPVGGPAPSLAVAGVAVFGLPLLCYNPAAMSNQQLQPPAPGSRKQQEQVAGLVERVTFHNEESGFCVLRVKARGHRDLVTLVGTLPEIRAGEWLEAQGRWTVNKEYGQQFQAL